MKNTWVELDLGVLRDNIHRLALALGSDVEIIYVVKANAYGHGLRPVAACAWNSGVRSFAVSHMDEALALRDQLPEARILMVGVIEEEDAAEAAAKDLQPIVVDERHAKALAARSESLGTALACHAKIDTGMGRLGFPWETAAGSLGHLVKRPGLNVVGICTHFASAGGSDGFADVQAERFDRVVADCHERGFSFAFKHIANSDAIICRPDSDLDGVRPGILLYGYEASGEAEGASPPVVRRAIGTRPFLCWKTRIVQVKRVPAGFPVSYGSTYTTDRETHIATLDAGYADGYSRLLGNRGCVLIKGRRRPVVGRVTMNLTTVDLGPVADACEGEEAVLIGSQEGEAVWADEVAAWCQTISYEVLTSIPTGVCREEVAI